MKRKPIKILALLGLVACLTGCMGSSTTANAVGGELIGVRGTAITEPTPYGMVAVNKGSLKVGLAENDTLWGAGFPAREISVDGFWMDEHEVSNAKYRQFVYWVRDSIIRERLADPAYGGDETYKIEEDEEGNPINPYLNWSKPIPWRKANEDELRAIESVYVTHPIDGTVMLDAKQMNYRYEVYDYAAAALRKHRMNPEELQKQIIQLQDQLAKLTEENAALKKQVADAKAAADTADAAKTNAEKQVESVNAEFSAYRGKVEGEKREERVNALVKAGKLKPADREKVLNFAAKLAEQNGSIDFAAPDGKKESLTLEEHYLRELEAAPVDERFVNFSAAPSHAADAVPSYTSDEMAAKL